MNKVAEKINKSEIEISDWFNTLVATIRVDELKIQTKTASKELTTLYNLLMSQDLSKLQNAARTGSTMYFIQALVLNYVTELQTLNKIPLKIALSHNNSSVMVWAEIKDNDETTEDALLIAEAKVNAKYSSYGFHISSTIVEKSDNLPVPSHYLSIIKEKSSGNISRTSKSSK